jgi:hypothetical protein
MWLSAPEPYTDCSALDEEEEEEEVWYPFLMFPY